MAKSESKALIEAYAKTSGKPAEEIAAEIAGIFGYQKANIPIPTNGDGEQKLSPMMQAIIEARKVEREMGATGKGEVSPMIKMMMETVTMMPLMKIMSGMDGSASPKPQENIMELLAKNDEKWERRLAQEKADREKEDTRQQLNEMKALILSSSGGKKDELIEKFETLNEKLDTEKSERFKDALDAQKTELSQFREDMRDAMDDLRNQPPQKNADEGFFEMMQKMTKFDSMVRSRGKDLGMTDEQIDKEVERSTPMKQQMLKDGVKLLERWIDVTAGKKPNREQPEIAQPEIAQSITCGNCHGVSNNGTDWCDACRIQYANDVVAAQQKAAAEATQKAPTTPQQTEAEARAKGEIPPDIVEVV